MADFPADIYTEPSDIDPETLKNRGPLAPFAGVREGKRGVLKIAEPTPNWLMRNA